MIGDDWEVDVCGANNFGIDAVYLNQKQIGSKEIRSNVKKTVRIYHIESLNQLMCLL